MNMHAPLRLNDRITEDDAFEAAEKFFACVMGDNNIMADCGLDEEDFAEDLHRRIFREAARLFHSQQSINSVSLKPGVPKDLPGLPCTPAEYLHRLQMLGINPATKLELDACLQTIKGVALSRGLAEDAKYASELATEGHSLLTLGDEIELLEQRLKERRVRLSALKAGVSAADAYLASFNASARRDGVIGVPIAMPEIAKVLSEPVFEAGNLYGLLSSSGEGKTSLTMQIILCAVKAGHPVLFLSYDQSAAQSVRQMIAQEKGIDLKQQREPNERMSQTERDTCVNFALWLKKQPLEIIRCQREGITQLVAYARRFIKKHANNKTALVVVDHIGKVKPRDPKLSADRISGEVTVEAKACADETQAAWLVLNQRNSFGTRRDNPRPIAADLYGGEGARADYDAVMYLYRAEKYKAEREKIAATDADWKKINKVFGSDIAGLAEIGVIKSRFGDPTLTETLKFEARYTRYVSDRPAVAQERML